MGLTGRVFRPTIGARRQGPVTILGKFLPYRKGGRELPDREGPAYGSVWKSKIHPPKGTVMNAMCLGTQQRQIAEGDRSHGFHRFTMARLYYRASLHGWTWVFAEMTWLGMLFLCSMAQFLIATLTGPVYPDIIAFRGTARAPP